MRQDDKRRTNREIRASRLRLVGPKGEPLGIVTLEDALRQAEAAGLDLVEIAPEADPPVAQLMDYNKMRCDRQKRERKARRAKREAGILVEPKTKEVKFRVKIAPHDYDVKVRHARAFLTQGHRVKLVITLRGREAEHQDLAAQLLERCVRDLSEVGAVEHRDLGEPKYKSVTMVSKKT